MQGTATTSLKDYKMPLKGRLRSNRSKRFGNVLNDNPSKSEEMNYSSSESEPEAVLQKNKVRKEFTKRLLRESECFTVDNNDHIYTRVRSPGATHCPVRKRQISEESDEKPEKKRCFSKNAVMARLNRERKKKYVSSLETENETLRKENNEITQKMEEQNKQLSVLKREITYLKGLLANSKELELILRNLRVTGLPVTSSIIPAAKQEFPCKSTEEENKNLVESHPRIRSVNSGYNFPILDKDINLGSCSDNSFNEMTDLENYPFHFENDSFDVTTPNLNEDHDFFSFNNQNLDLELEECLKLENLSKNTESPVGICLHVNQKRISVEICSICNLKAASSGDLPEEVF